LQQIYGYRSGPLDLRMVSCFTDLTEAVNPHIMPNRYTCKNRMFGLGREPRVSARPIDTSPQGWLAAFYGFGANRCLRSGDLPNRNHGLH